MIIQALLSNNLIHGNQLIPSALLWAEGIGKLHINMTKTLLTDDIIKSIKSREVLDDDETYEDYINSLTENNPV